MPGTTRSTPTGRDCLAADTAQTQAWLSPCPNPASTQAPLPDFSVSSTCPTMEQAPATKPAAEALPALVMSFASWVTWLEGVTPLASGRMCGLPPRHSFSQLAASPRLAISGVRTQKLPLTLRSPLFAAPGATTWLPNSVFGSVSQDTHRQALTGLSWLSFSRPLAFPAVPERGQRPASAVTSLKAPHAGTRSTNLPLRTGPNPVGGFAARGPLTDFAT